MTTYSYAQLEGLWISAGGNPASAPIAAAIATAESGGNSNAFNGSDPAGGSRGLWQINGVHGSQSTFDPAGNAKAAVAISNNGKDWSPWSTFTSGAYQRYLKSGVQAVNTSGTLVGSNPATSDKGSSASSDCCAIGFGGVSTGVASIIPGVPNNVGGVCFLSKTQVNSLVGFVVMGAGLLVGMAGLGWVLVYAFKKSGALNTVITAAVPELGAITSAAGLAQQVQKHTPNRASSSGGGRQARKRPAPEPEPLEVPVPKKRTTRP